MIYFQTDRGVLHQGHVMDILREMPDESVHCVVTSPPYWGLRDYGIDPQVWDGEPDCEHVWGDENKQIATGGKDHHGHGSWTNDWKEGNLIRENRNISQGQFCQKCQAWRGSLGLEPTIELYLSHLVQIFREVKRVLHKPGTIWLNLGDSYAGGGRGGGFPESTDGRNNLKPGIVPSGLKPKDLCGIPWRVALALQADGWWLRQDIIWEKSNPMPESVTDRCCKSHEYMFLLTKSREYYFDHIAIQEPTTNQKMLSLQKKSSIGSIQQKQSKEGWSNGELQGMSIGSSEEMELQIQPNRESQENGGAILLFEEGAEGQKDISQEVQVNARTNREVQSSWKISREGTKIQGKNNKISEKSEGQSKQSQDGQEAPISNECYGLHPNGERMGENKERSELQMFLLWEETETSRNGTCDPIVSPGNAHERKRSPIVSEVQQQEIQQITKRNKRSVWHINTQSFSAAHFATFPEKLVEPCVKAGTSEKGCCPECLEPWVRIIEKEYGKDTSSTNHIAGGDKSIGQGWEGTQRRAEVKSKTIGWKQNCKCKPAEPVSCVCLDPFFGSGTVAVVAERLRRDWIGIELSEDYAAIAEKRVKYSIRQRRLF